jgi:hypothetical protein
MRVSIWSLAFRGKKPTYPELAQAARDNFRLASDKQLKDGCGLKRSAVKKVVDRLTPVQNCQITSSSSGHCRFLDHLRRHRLLSFLLSSRRSKTSFDA